MSEVVTSIDIQAPPEKVWALAMDPKRFDDWVTIHRGLHDHDGGAPREGYEMVQTLCLRGVHFKVHWELVSCADARHAEWHGRGPARSHAETEYRLTPIDGGTHFDYRNEFKAPLGPLGAVASRALVGGVPKREANASLRKLKALAEKS
ncbi:MAG: SRPBCC family protein [Solirubrobacteraceae bacterium]